MAKKGLLNEAQVRKFMKLARLEPLASRFVNEMGPQFGAPEEEEIEEVRTGRPPADLSGPRRGHGRGNGPEDRLEEGDDDMDADDIAGDDDMDADDIAGDDDMDADLDSAPDVGAELEAPSPGAAGKMISVEDFLSALETALEGVMGDEVEIDSDEMEEPPAAPPMDDLPEPEGDDMDADDMGGDEEELMEMVYRRVQTRLKKASETSKKNALAEQVTKRVAARILKEALKK
jgi:hypothetical protein